MAKWFVHEESGESGPWTSNEMRQLVAEGRLGPESVIRREDMEQWVRASGLANLFARASDRLQAQAGAKAGAAAEERRPPREHQGVVKPRPGSKPVELPPPEPERPARHGVVKPRAGDDPAPPSADLEDVADELIDEVLLELGLHENDAELEELRRELGLDAKDKKAEGGT